MNTTRIRRFDGSTTALVICLLLLVVGCDRSFDSEKEELEKGKALWAAAGPQNYEIVFDMRCNCDDKGAMQKTLVCDGVTRIGKYSVSSIFDLADLALAEDDISLAVNIDSTLGYPKTISFGSSLGFDSQVEFEVTDFHAIDNDQNSPCRNGL